MRLAYVVKLYGLLVDSMWSSQSHSVEFPPIILNKDSELLISPGCVLGDKLVLAFRWKYDLNEKILPNENEVFTNLLVEVICTLRLRGGTPIPRGHSGSL